MNVAQLVSSFGVVLEMLEDRGFEVDSVRELHSKAELEDIYLKSNNPSSVTIDCGCKNARIFYFNLASLKKHVKAVQTGLLDKETISLHIIVFTENALLTPNGCKSLMDAYKVAKIKCNLFHWHEVAINKSRHFLVPKHEILSKEEEQAVLEQYNSTKLQLPWIQRTDPMARYLGIEPGQLVRIKSSSPTAGEYISYRTCV